MPSVLEKKVCLWPSLKSSERLTFSVVKNYKRYFYMVFLIGVWFFFLHFYLGLTEFLIWSY